MQTKATTWYVYILRCADDTLYTGMASNVEKRVTQHNKGHGAKSIKGKLPVTLVYQEICETHLLAARREIEIKSWSRTKKLLLVEHGETKCEPRGI